jgi:hypothetical protein
MTREPLLICCREELANCLKAEPEESRELQKCIASTMRQI